MFHLKSKNLFLLLSVVTLYIASCGSKDSSTKVSVPSLKEGMVAAAHPLAAQAGADVLKEGGNAIDAAVATAFALNVVEPHASGVGGGGFIMIYLADTNEVRVIDYREVAPSGLTEDHFTDDGKFSSSLMRYQGKAVGVPGTTRGLLQAHEQFGSMNRERLLEPAITYAIDGHPVSSDLSGQIAAKLDPFSENETAAELFLEDGIFPLEEGSIIKQENLGKVMQAIATNGDEGFYNPTMAETVATEVRKQGGFMIAEDILNYQPEARESIAASYRGYEIVTIGPPSAGGLSVLQALSILDHFDLSSYTAESPEYLTLLAKSLEAAQISTDKYVADPNFVSVPINEMLAAEWSANHAEMIRKNVPVEKQVAMLSMGANAIPFTDEHVGNTTHLSVVDKDGNMVALTQTINYFFGSRVIIPEHGFFMNNEMADFSYEKGSVNIPVPGKRPRSSISPVLVMKDGRPIAAIGSPGGRRIPSALVQIIVRCIDFNESMQEAIDAPRVYVDSGSTRLAFEPRFPEGTMDQVGKLLSQEKEWDFQERGKLDRYFGGAQGIWIRDTATGPVLEGGADPRRAGAVASTAN